MKKLIEIKRPSGIAKSSYNNTMSLLGVKDGPAFDFSTCKEEVYHMVGKALGTCYDYESQEYIMGPDNFHEEINIDEPGVILYVDKVHMFSAARRINKIVKLLHKNHKLKTRPTVFLYKGSSAVLVKVNKWYYKNAVSLSGLLTFIRAASCHDFSFDSIEEFIEKIMDNSHSTADGDHIKDAKKNGNLEGFLNKSLPIIKYKGNAWKWGREDEMAWDGLVRYDKTEVSYIDISDGLSWKSGDDYDDECECEDCTGW